MNLQTFRAPSMAECLAEVKRVMGPDAVILHTRTVAIKRFLGLRRREIVEITAGRGLNGGPRGTRRALTGGPRMMEIGGNGGNAVATVPASAPPRDSLPPAPIHRPHADPIFPPHRPAMRDIVQQVNGLFSLVKELMKDVRSKDTPEVPEELFDEYTALTNAMVERDVAKEIVKTLHRTLRPDHLTQKQFVREKIAEQLEKLLPTSGPIQRMK